MWSDWWVFSLSVLWWRMIRDLRKLPDGRDWLRVRLGLVPMARAMLSKSLIEFSVEKPCMHRNPGERSSGSTRDWTRLVCECLQQRHGSVVAYCSLGALSVTVHAWDLLKEVAIVFITSPIVWPQVNNREGTQLHPLTEKILCWRYLR